MEVSSLAEQGVASDDFALQGRNFILRQVKSSGEPSFLLMFKFHELKEVL
jgi:hypothetical protein